MSSNRRLTSLIVPFALLCGSALGGCELLAPVAIAALDPDASITAPEMLVPEVEASDLILRKRPPLTKLAAYYCPKVVSGTVGTIGCTVGLGSPPPKDTLRFDFGMAVSIKNPNDVPVPALDVLVAVTLFPGVKAEELGAMCVSLCGADDLKCDGKPRPGACTIDGTRVKSVDDFLEKRLPNLIEGLITGEVQEELKKSTIAAGGDVKLDLRFTMGVDQALTVFQRTALDWVDQFLDGKDPVLKVPVSAQGSVFFDVPVLGQLKVDYGPLSTEWVIE
ncbi:MAG: hypothetical protein KC502_21655 [Myxococcales bacterium]|nr:hypothetical protein [Myxococcales bacterium]